MTDVSSSDLREVVGLFDAESELQAAIDALLSNGFDRAELSFLASEEAIKARLGAKYRRVEELEDNPDVPRAAYVSTESIGDAQGVLIGTPLYVAATAAAGAVLISGGTLALAIAGAAAAGGAGALAGSILARFVGQQHAQSLQEHLDNGGLLLWVRCWTPDDEKRALDILKASGAEDVHAHSLDV